MFSPSQISAYDCPRRWAWRSIHKVPSPQKASAALGTAVHAEIERHLRFGVTLDLLSEPGQIAMTGAHLWPRNVPGLVIEDRTTWSLGGHRFQGIRDLSAPPGHAAGVASVWDHKTTGDFRWMKSPAELGDEATTPPGTIVDFQAALYAYAAIDAGAEAVDLTWIYYRTKKPYAPARPVRARTRLAVIQPTLDVIQERADRMKHALDHGTRALDLAPNVQHCDDFGGCPYLSLCNLTPQERLQSAMANADALENHQATIAELQARLALPGAAAPGAINPPSAATDRAPAPPGWRYRADGSGHLEAIPAAPPVAAPAPAPAPAVVPPAAAAPAPVVEAAPAPVPVVEDAAAPAATGATKRGKAPKATSDAVPGAPSARTWAAAFRAFADALEAGDA